MLNNMKIYSETSLRNFRAWSGGAENLGRLTIDQCDELEAILEDAYPEGMDETTLNDLLWFDFETVLDWLGLYQDQNTLAVYDSDEADETAGAWFAGLPVCEACALMECDDLDEARDAWDDLGTEEKFYYYNKRK